MNIHEITPLDALAQIWVLYGAVCAASVYNVMVSVRQSVADRGELFAGDGRQHQRHRLALRHVPRGRHPRSVADGPSVTSSEVSG